MSSPRRTSKLVMVLCVAAAGAIAACSAPSARKSIGEGIDDVAITTKVKSALVEDPAPGRPNRIDVTTVRGVVQLEGEVATEADRAQATAVAQRIEGVRDVRNNLIVSGTGHSAPAAP